MPDGELWKHQAEITERLVSAVMANNVDRLMTLGASGYDHHPDHITSHEAAVHAVEILHRRYQRDIGLLALNNGHCGSETVHGTPHTRQRKLRALASHESQFPLEPLNGSAVSSGQLAMAGFAIDAGFWDSFSHYHPLILDGETYDAA